VASTVRSRTTSLPTERSPTTRSCEQVLRFGIRHSPVELSAQGRIRPVSCYALFQWWLLLSQHPGCLRAPTSFPTEPELGTLAAGLGCFPLDDEAYPPSSHSRVYVDGIRSLVEFGNPVRPLAHPVLYRRHTTPEAAPQCISGRTSYLQVRLAFHRYPQFIRAVFNRHRFGPSSRISGTSP
jgi:hypothetical protein